MFFFFEKKTRKCFLKKQIRFLSEKNQKKMLGFSLKKPEIFFAEKIIFFGTIRHGPGPIWIRDHGPGPGPDH